jgi:phage baseplate assembly protein W
MANLYNQQKVAVNKASVGDQTSTTFTYKGFSSQNAKQGFKLYDIDLVKQDLINHFYIKKGEKLQNPDFGTIIWDMIFEPFTEETKKLIADDVETIVNYDPRVVVDSVSVDSTEMGMRIEASITYLPFNVSDRMTFDFDRTTSTIK